LSLKLSSDEYINMNPGTKQNSDSKYLVFAGILLVVVIFNLIVVTGLDVLLHDSPRNYKYAIEGKFPWSLVKHFVLYPFMDWAAWKMTVVSPSLTRAIFILFFLVPISCCFYYLYRFKLGFPRAAAFAAAVLPHILPHQWQIPAGIGMSRTVFPLLTAAAALLLGIQYLEKNTPKNWARLAGSAFLYIVCCQLMEQALFLFPPMALLFLGYTKWNKKHIRLLALFSLIAAARYIQIIMFTRKARVMAPLEEILRRVGLYFKYSLPLPDIGPVVPAVLYTGIFLAGFFLLLRHPETGPQKSIHFSHMKRNMYAVYLYGFAALWAGVTVLPFITMGAVIFPPRYSYISAFGINAIFVLSIYVILNRGFLKKANVHYIALAALIVFSGVYRYVNLKTIYDAKNNVQALIVDTLKKIQLPPNSQVVISGMPEMAHGHIRATGYMMYALKRNDVIGRFRTVAPGDENNFINHFDPKDLALENAGQFRGIYFDKPAFFFVLDKGRTKLKQFEYVLHWKGKTKIAPWTILRADKRTGSLSPFKTGEGMDGYLSTLTELKKQGIPREDILWGGVPSTEESKRLERVELDPALYRSGFYFYPPGFEKIDPGMVERIRSLPGTVDLSGKDLTLGDRFRLTAFSIENISDEKGRKTAIVHLLWVSLEKQVIKRNVLRTGLWVKKKKIWQGRDTFCSGGVELGPGDYVFGHIRIPGHKFKRAHNLDIRMRLPSGLSKRIVLEIPVPGNRE